MTASGHLLVAADTDRQDQSDPGVPPPQGTVCTAIQPASTGFELAEVLRASQRWFLSSTFRSCLPGLHRPVVPVHPVVVGAALHPIWPTRRARLSPASTAPLRRNGGTGLTPAHGLTAPRGARSLTSTRIISASWCAWRQIQSDDVDALAFSSGSAESLNVSAFHGLTPVLVPARGHRGVPDPQPVTQQPRRPVGYAETLRWRRQGRRDHLCPD